MSDDKVLPTPLQLSDDAAHRLLARAIELDHSRGAQTRLADLRAVALEAGTSVEAFDAAVKELDVRPSEAASRSHPITREHGGLVGRLWNRLRRPDRTVATIGDVDPPEALRAINNKSSEVEHQEQAFKHEHRLVATNSARFAFMRTMLRWSTVCVLGIACRDGSSAPSAPAATATVSHSTTDLTLQPGGGGAINFNIVRRNGHKAPIGFFVDDVPLGITAQFNQASVSGDTRSTTLLLSAGFLIQTGSYTMKVRVEGDGVAVQDIPVTLTVVDPRIVLTAGEPTATVEQQKSVSLPIAVSRIDGYTGLVGLSAVGLPPGVTAEFSPVTLLPDQTTSMLTLTASLAAAVESSSITIRATGTGVVHSTASFGVTVAPTTTPGVLLVPNPSVLHLRPGESIDAPIEIRRFAGYQGSLNFETLTTPAGINATFVPTQNGDATVLMRISAASNANIGHNVITMRAIGSGITAEVSQLTVHVVSQPTYALVTPLVATITQGTTATNDLMVQLNRISGFSEAVRLSAVGLPSGVSITPAIDGFEIASTENRAFFSYIVAANAAPGPRTFTVQGVSTSTGVTSSVVVPIVVRPSGSYVLFANPSAVSMPHGASRGIEITIVRVGGFSGTISFSMSSLDFATSAQFVPQNTTGNTVQMRVSAALGAMPRSYPILVRGTSPGTDAVEIPLTVTITP